MLYGQPKLKLLEVERDWMRVASQFNARLMDFIRPHVRAGVTTGEIDKLVHDYTLDHGRTPACLGYQGFSKSCCTSINEVICHGIPGPRVLEPGDIINIDLTTIVDGWFGDQSETFLIGEVSDEARHVSQCALDCLYAGIEATRPGGRVADIGKAIVDTAHRRGYSVVREYVGHGIGRQFHQDPSIPHFPTLQSHRDRIEPGMCFTIEPMVNVGRREAELDKDDGWTVRTKDRSLTAQFEHTILMTEEGPEILTLTQDGPQRGHKF